MSLVAIPSARPLSSAVLLALASFLFTGCGTPNAGVANREEPLRLDFRPGSERPIDDGGLGMPTGGPNDVARFLAGMSSRLRPDFQKTKTWETHRTQIDVRWDRAEGRLAPIRSFRRAELAGLGQGHVFYPFGGPDFLYADAFFPNAGTYTLVGLEAIGNIPDLSSLSEAQIATSLRGLQTSISSSLDYSYFLTKDMREDLARTNLKGVLPILYVYLARTGHRIHSVDYVHLTSSGQIGSGQ